MSNIEISNLLRQVAAAYSIKDESKYRFQIIAYQKAADAIENATDEVKHLIAENKLDDLPGVGPSIQKHLNELINTGRVEHFETVMKELPPAMFPLLNIPSFGPKKAYKLVSTFNLSNPKTVVKDLLNLANNDKIASLEGFGSKSQDDIKRALTEFGAGVDKTSRMVLPFATEIAEKLIEYLKKSPHVIEAYPLGSLRRRLSTIGDVDIAVATNNPKKVLEYFTQYPYKERVIEKGEATSSILISGGKHIDLMVQPPERFGSLLQHFTGSKAHNVHLREYALKKGLSLSEYGIKPKGDDEKKRKAYSDEKVFYRALGLEWIPPEIREDTGEIELAIENKLPKLIELKDMKGDFHIHSSFPIEPSHDLGADTMEEMVKKAISLNYEYLGFSEHNPSVSKHTSKQVYDLLLKRKTEIERLSLKYKKSLRVFSLLETDILPHGNLAIDEKSLELLDATIVSIHSVFSMSRSEMTERVLKGLSHPKAKILAHPTGRLLNQRQGYELNWKEIFTFCRENDKALEVNSWPARLDLPDTLVKEAIMQGVKLVINTDSHAVAHMDLMRYGIDVARRGWAKKADILNAQEYNDVIQWFNKRR